MTAPFECFPDATRRFLAGIANNNEKSWFDANRPLYEAGYVEVGKRFVEEIAPRQGGVHGRGPGKAIRLH